MDRTGRRLTPAAPNEPTPDRKLQCLCSWLERTNQRETHAVHARVLLPISAMTIGATLAAALVSVDAHWFATCTLTLALTFAFIAFLIHRRQCHIWQQVARWLQKEQRILTDHDRESEWPLVGRIAPDRLADRLGKSIPTRFFAFDVISLYAAALLISVLFALFAYATGETDTAARIHASPLIESGNASPPARSLQVQPTF